jgi:hypothetical protein
VHAAEKVRPRRRQLRGSCFPHRNMRPANADRTARYSQCAGWPPPVPAIAVVLRMRRQEPAAPAIDSAELGLPRLSARPRSGSHRPPWRIRRRCRGCPKTRRQSKKKPESATHRRTKVPLPGAVNRTAKKRFAETFSILGNAALSVRSNIMNMADVSGIKIVRYVQEDDKAASE